MIPVLIFLSGLSALIYELLWIKTLTLVFGSTIYAVSAVLTVFFSGLALGNYYFGKRSDISRNPLQLYGILELLIGLYAILYPHILNLLTPLYLAGDSFLEWPSATHLLRFMVTMMVLLPPASMMGGTLPLLVSDLAGRKGAVGRSTAFLYSLNTAGAIAGSLLAGFFLIGYSGVNGSMEIAALINVAVAIIALVTSRSRSRSIRSDSTVEWRSSAQYDNMSEQPPDVFFRVILLVAGVSGFASLGYEVVWTRMLIHYTGTTTYAFTTILATFLVGIAGGGYVSHRLMRGKRNLWLALALIEAGIGVTAVISTAVIDNMTAIDAGLNSLIASPIGGGWREGLLITLCRSSAVMFFPAFLMGMSLPAAVGIVDKGRETAGRTVGNVFSVNTSGSIAGSFLAGFVLIPVLGVGWTMILLSAVNVALSLLLLACDPIERHSRGLLAFMGALLFVLVVVPRKELFRSIYPPESLVCFIEGPSSTVAVVSDQDPLNPGYLRMFVDGNGLSGTDYSGRRYMKLLGHLPVVLSGGEPEDALVICLGTGMTLGAVSLCPTLKRLDCVEISKEVVEAAAYFEENNNHVLEHERARIVIDDGRSFLQTSRRSYDLITLEPPPPRSAGVVNLYSREFYLQAGNRLKEGGVLCQWIPLHDQSEEDVKTLVRTFLDVFPHVTCWLIERNELALVGSRVPQSIDLARIRELFEHEETASDLASVDIVDAYDLLSLYLMDDSGLREYAGTGEIVTDDRPVIEFFLFHGGNYSYRYSPGVRESYLPALENMRNYRGDVRSLIPAWRQLRSHELFDHKMAIRHFTDATILRNRGDEEGAKREFQFAAKSVSDNSYALHYLGVSDEQLAEVRKRVETDGGNLALLNRLGYIYSMRGESGAARRTFERVLALEPSNTDARINLGIVLEEAGEIKEAESAFRKVGTGASGDLSNVLASRLEVLAAKDTARRSDDPALINEVALMLWNLRKYKDAVSWFVKATAVSPEWELAYYNLAATYEAIGRYADALEYYERSYNLKKSGEAANNIEKLRFLLSIEKEGAAEVELTDGQRMHVAWDDPRSHNQLGIRFYRNREYHEAIGSFMRAVEEKPDYAEALVNAGDSYRETGDFRAALSCYRRARDLDQSLEEAIDKRTEMLEREPYAVSANR